LKSEGAVNEMNIKERYEESPFWSLIGMKVDSIEENSARIKLKVTRNLLNGNNILHGGVVTTLLDAAMGINLKLNIVDAPYSTISLTSQFIKIVKEDELIYGSAEIIQIGRSVACVEARLSNENGEVIGMGLGTFKINRPR
jgi:uncharacterized protein (TIGR00369 family)